jgi:hypothetical protein
MDTYVDLVASTQPILTLFGCQSMEGLLDNCLTWEKKLVGEKNKIRPKIKAKKDTDTITILLYSMMTYSMILWGGGTMVGGSYLNGIITFSCICLNLSAVNWAPYMLLLRDNAFFCPIRSHNWLESIIRNCVKSVCIQLCDNIILLYNLL